MEGEEGGVRNAQTRRGRGRGGRSHDRVGIRANTEWVNKADAPLRDNAADDRGQMQIRRASNNTPRAQAWRERKKGAIPDEHQSRSSDLATDFKGMAISKSDPLPQLVQELQDKLRNGEIECMICFDMVRQNAPIWSCCSCYSIFHLTCIRKWARAPTSIDKTANGNGVRNWRCPGCQTIQNVSANDLRYWCFCGQHLEPPVDFYLTPHSCGGPCQKPLDKSRTRHCKHLCTLQCHPGPCPPCMTFAPSETCGCGRTTLTRRCGEERGEISCGRPCGRVLSCGRHHCSRNCHVGDCGECSALITVSCFCKRKQDQLICGQILASGRLTGSGVFSCDSSCSRLLPCGNHKCSKKCHSGDCGGCELSPEKLQTCPCSKRTLEELLGNGKTRKSCLDPIPTCGQVCGKILTCQRHGCESLCHLGACPPCNVLVEQKCRCGDSSRTVPCGESSQDDFVCDRKCGEKKNCGRHRCNNRCCSSSQDEHLCMLECGKRLRCGQHFCRELCHLGHCRPCLQSSFTDLTCACGKSSIPPPVPCGTPRPRCDYPCSVPQPCGHVATHTCHFGDCPPCTVPVVKECVGGHTIMRNVPCGSKEIKCNRLCRKTRKCEIHLCSRTCHAGPCDAEPRSTNLSCGQVCGSRRRDCPHTCVAPCHPLVPCPDLRCNFMVTITCSCERQSASVPCDVGGSTGRDTLPVLGTTLPPLQPVQGKVPLSQRKIACDDECVKAQRLKGLADALGIQTTPGDALAAYGGSDCLQEMLKRDSQFVTAVEDRFKYLLQGPRPIACVNGMRVHAFCGLPKEKREAIHQLAQRWNLSVNSVGWEPKRFMIVHVNSKSRIPPARLTKSNLPAPVFSPSLDVDPKQVVALMDLPREGDISSLVLRFGGECELIWLNDRNALAIFGDPGRAATALKRVDHASAYHGAFVMPAQSQLQHQQHHRLAGWGVPTSSSVRSTTDSKRGESSQQQQQLRSLWQKRNPMVPVNNPWEVLEQAGTSSSEVIQKQQPAASSGASSSETVVEDWETAYD